MNQQELLDWFGSIETISYRLDDFSDADDEEDTMMYDSSDLCVYVGVSMGSGLWYAGINEIDDPILYVDDKKTAFECLSELKKDLEENHKIIFRKRG
jgi:hypothetical protein